ncbi:helix-turn-helix transcriptional regulator [Lacinutrix sp.]|uniref:helix-turn-helix domain-containing protein n=1 Tax=Lacinutrix sp. TaxID=1937692 RepID=UPI0025BAEC99|nr:helix-turn-helix transcriptional regulator [Lacinutrix sp.]
MKIRQFRHQKGISQNELADLLNVAQTTISNFEADRTLPDIVMIDKIAKELDKDVSEFLANDAGSFINEGQKGGVTFQNIGTVDTINSISDKLIEQYEKRLEEKDEIICMLKEQVKNN